MDKITVGKMAKLHDISERSLRLYHDLGLLTPKYVDENTSYRYYSSSQSARLNIILQMKSIGLSLAQIKHLLDSRDLSLFTALLHQQLDMIDTQIADLKRNRALIKKRLNNCTHLINPPSLNNIFVEYQPARKALCFDIEAYDYELSMEQSINKWESALLQVKNALRDDNVQADYFSEVGATIGLNNLRNGRFLCDTAIIMVYEEPQNSKIPIRQIQAGTYVCAIDHWQSGNSAAEVRGIKSLLAYIDEQGFDICGDYVAEVIAESSILDYETHKSLIKMQIPVNAIQPYPGSVE